MKKKIIFFVIAFLPFFVLAKPYYSEYIENQKDKQFLVIFHSENITSENEPKIKVLERKYLEYENGDYLEYKHLRNRIERELEKLGVTVEVIENQDWRLSKKVQRVPPYDIRRREVKCVKRDQNGDILAIGGDWGLITREEAIEDIKSGVYEYFVNVESNEVIIHIFLNKFLRTDPDKTAVNNLDELPDC